MTDPKDELRARFEDQAPTDDRDTDAADETTEEATDNTGDSDDIDNTDNASNMDNTGNSSNASNADNASGADATTNSDSSTEDQTSTASTPGPEKDTTATRHRRQVPMYLPEAKVTALNQLYERLDGRSKVAGEGGIEKHADFMEQLVEFAIEHEDDLAAKLDIQQ